ASPDPIYSARAGVLLAAGVSEWPTATTYELIRGWKENLLETCTHCRRARRVTVWFPRPARSERIWVGGLADSSSTPFCFCAQGVAAGVHACTTGVRYSSLSPVLEVWRIPPCTWHIRHNGRNGIFRCAMHQCCPAGSSC